MKCEDWPCCGHEEGGCPNSDGSYNCAECGKKLPKHSQSAVCEKCHRKWHRQAETEFYDYPEPY